MEVELLSVATASPEHVICQADALRLAQRICCTDDRQRRFASVLYQHSGVETRHGVLPLSEADRWSPHGSTHADGSPNYGPSTAVRMDYYQQHALPLAERAARDALDRSGCRARDITHMVTASCTGFTAPGVDLGLIERLELLPTTQRVQVGYMGCHGSINAIRAAQGLALLSARNRILVCSVELCTLHYAFQWSNERMLGNALFADGAGAVVLTASDASDGSANDCWRLAATGSYLFPGTTDAMTWTIGDFGFEMTISSELPRLIGENLGEWLTSWLDHHGLGVRDVNSWAIHPGGPRIIEAVEFAMGLSRELTEVSREVLAAHGNMSSATVLFILERLLEREAKPPCVMLGFGPGLVAEAVLFT